MARRNSPNDIRALDDLSDLGQVVVDKRLGQRSSAKKNRRNRHYENQFIRHALTHRHPPEEGETSGANDSPSTSLVAVHQDRCQHSGLD